MYCGHVVRLFVRSFVGCRYQYGTEPNGRCIKNDCNNVVTPTNFTSTIKLDGNEIITHMIDHSVHIWQTYYINTAVAAATTQPPQLCQWNNKWINKNRKTNIVTLGNNRSSSMTFSLEIIQWLAELLTNENVRCLFDCLTDWQLTQFLSCLCHENVEEYCHVIVRTKWINYI